MGVAYEENDEMCALAAMACICDIVTLQDENRTMVHRGLAVLNHEKTINPGLGCLITQRGYLDKPVDAYCIGFILGPCLNATGRLGSAALSVELLLTDDINRRVALAQELIALNNARKDLTADCVARVIADLEGETRLQKVLVLTDPLAHESVAGIVAGRIRDHTGRPTIMLTKGDTDMKGSGRSIAAYNLFGALYAHKHLFLRFGGHAMAAGLTLAAENIPALSEALNRDCTLTDDDFVPVYDIDCFLDCETVTLDLSRELEALAPFGKGNAAPLFATLDLQVENVRAIDAKNTLIFTFKNPGGYPLKGIAFGLNQQYAAAVQAAHVPPTGGYKMDAAYRIETNTYNGNVSVQMAIQDFKIL
jgi:single-stranded-DNA-specific exonuclease